MNQINSKKVALVFPGQGSQQIGMGQDFYSTEPDAKNAFSIVNKECDFDLLKLCAIGPEEALKRTCYTQPALLASSAASLQALRRYWTEDPLCVAGHSLGEFSALWAAGALTLKSTAELVVLRGQLMENAAPGAMAAILGLTAEQVKAVCDECEIVVANYNTPSQQVISGTKENLEKSFAKFAELKGKVIPLQVGGAFHSPLMDEANEKFSEAIKQSTFNNAICPVIQNIDAKAYTDATDLKSNICKQMTSSVLWVETIQNMLSLGTEAFIEVGSGKVLGGLIKKIDRAATVLQVSDNESLKATLESLGQLAMVS